MDVNLLKIKRVQTKMDNLTQPLDQDMRILQTVLFMRLPDLFLRRV